MATEKPCKFVTTCQYKEADVGLIMVDTPGFNTPTMLAEDDALAGEVGGEGIGKPVAVPAAAAVGADNNPHHLGDALGQQRGDPSMYRLPTASKVATSLLQGLQGFVVVFDVSTTCHLHPSVYGMLGAGGCYSGDDGVTGGGAGGGFGHNAGVAGDGSDGSGGSSGGGDDASGEGCDSDVGVDIDQLFTVSC